MLFRFISRFIPMQSFTFIFFPRQVLTHIKDNSSFYSDPFGISFASFIFNYWLAITQIYDVLLAHYLYFFRGKRWFLSGYPVTHLALAILLTKIRRSTHSFIANSKMLMQRKVIIIYSFILPFRHIFNNAMLSTWTIIFFNDIYSESIEFPWVIHAFKLTK